MPRTPGITSASACTVPVAARSSPSTSTSRSTVDTAGSASSGALTWWKAATTRLSGSTAAACSAALPSGTASGNGPRSSKPIGLTQSTTILPASSPVRLRSVSACPAYGTVTMTRSARPATSPFGAPRQKPSRSLRFTSSAARAALPSSRDPISTDIPAAWNRNAKPCPWSPVPPSTPMVSERTSGWSAMGPPYATRAAGRPPRAGGYFVVFLAAVFFAVVFAAVPVDFVVVFFAGAFAALALVALAGAGGVPPLVPVLLAVVFAAGALVAFAGISASSTALVDVTEGCDAVPVNAPRRSGRSPVLPCIVLGVVAGVPLAHGLQHAGRVFGCREWTEPVGAGAAEVRFDALVLHAPPPAPLHDDLHHAVHRSRPRTRVPPTALVVFRIFDSMKLQPPGGHRGRGRPTSDQRSMPVWPRE